MAKRQYSEADIVLVDLPQNSRFRDLTGEIYGKLRVIGYSGDRRWFVRCECGTITKPTSSNLRTGQARSCGCAKPSSNIKKWKWENLAPLPPRIKYTPPPLTPEKIKAKAKWTRQSRARGYSEQVPKTAIELCRVCGKKYRRRFESETLGCSRECSKALQDIQRTVDCPCGASFVREDPSSKYCSLECKNRCRAIRIDRPCKVCGRSNVTNASQAKLTCSKECAKVFWRRRMDEAMVKRVVVARKNRIKKLPICYSLECHGCGVETMNSRSRHCDDCNVELKTIRRARSRLRSKVRYREKRRNETEEDTFRRKIRERVVRLGLRIPLSQSKTVRKPTTISLELRRLKRKQKWKDLCPWRKKIINKKSNMRKRRRRKDARRIRREYRNRVPAVAETKRHGVQMLFEWN